MSKLYLIAAVIVSFALLPSVEAVDYRYSVITIENHTEFRVYYSYTWGEGNQIYRGSIAPNSSYIHWWEFAYINQNYAPWFYMQIDGQDEWHKMGSFFSPNTDQRNGRLYAIKMVGHGNNRRFQLHEWLYKQ